MTHHSKDLPHYANLRDGEMYEGDDTDKIIPTVGGPVLPTVIAGGCAWATFIYWLTRVFG